MTIAEFRLLSLDQQESAVETHGVFLGNRHKDNLYITLHQIAGFYIEVYIHQKENRVIGLSSFTDVNNLDPYLKKIDIAPLLQAF